MKCIVHIICNLMGNVRLYIEILILNNISSKTEVEIDGVFFPGEKKETVETFKSSLLCFFFPMIPIVVFALPLLILRHAQVFSIPCSYCTRKDYVTNDFDLGFILRHDVTNR